ncbi:RNA polymerase iii subunit rpc82 [Mucor ambiguus]|uniref:DNA-directed RNA polymerase III subunit RPC3 n=1 Tax=Mucor ambiguus TaxID=91626 RepID=A0A0C9MGA0_9FUNG|nr:RNA polymerase iii subunit rpc82 [Mucor ambiguus]
MSCQARLCREIIREEFGSYPALIADLLLLKGRLTLSDLVRFSRFKAKHVRECLVVLIQHGVVYFSESTTDSVKADAPTFYEIDPEKILMRLRMGRIMRISEEHYGKPGSAICKLLFLYGRVQLSQVLQWAAIHDDKQKDESAYKRAFTLMAQEQFIAAVLPQHSRSVTDRYMEAEAKELEKYTIITSGEAKQIKETAKANTDAIYHQEEFVGMKRRASDILQSEAKRRAQETGDYTFETEGEKLESQGRKKSKPLLFDVDPNVFFALNYDRYNIYFRNHMVVEFATDKINRTAGIVIKTFFRHGKEKLKNIKDDYSPAATPSHIANMLDADVFQRGDLLLDLAPGSSKKKELPDVSQVVNGYFQLLLADDAGFLTKRDELGANQYAVNFKRVRHVMKRHLFEGLLKERFGIASCRIIRILLDKGKLEESQIQKLAMLPPKDVRFKLDVLLTHGIVDIQEVPRSADRATSRSFHLWFVSIDKCFDALITEIYRTITNLQQRKNEELVRRSRLLEKLSRIDVLANMQLLNEIDKAEVSKMDTIVSRIEIAKDRLDAMLMIFRDF